MRLGLLPWRLQPEWEARGWRRCREGGRGWNLPDSAVRWWVQATDLIQVSLLPGTPSDPLSLWSLHALPCAPHPLLFLLLGHNSAHPECATVHATSPLKFLCFGKTKFTQVVIFLSVQLSANKYIHTVVQPSPPSSRRSPHPG